MSGEEQDKAEQRAHWPKDVRSLNWGNIGKLGLHEGTGELYWDGKRVETTFGLSRRNEIIAWIVAGATVSMALLDLLRFIGGE